MENIYLDIDGYKEYVDLLISLEDERRKLITRLNNLNIVDNKEEYKELLELIKKLDIKLDEKKVNLRRIVVIKNNEQKNKNIVDINDVVAIKIKLPEHEKIEICKLVASSGNFMGEVKKISINSPLGNAIYNKKVGDTTYYKVNNKQIDVEIIEKREVKKLIK